MGRDYWCESGKECYEEQGGKIGAGVRDLGKCVLGTNRVRARMLVRSAIPS